MAVLVNDRLKVVRNALKLSQRDFSKGIYISQSFYARMEQGKLEINNRIIELISSRYKVSKNWLKEGKGEMFTEKPDVN
jgi:transcriptional regulator with XRE-family HTH domain